MSNGATGARERRPVWEILQRIPLPGPGWRTARGSGRRPPWTPDRRGSWATDFVEVAAGGEHTLARRADGSVVAWGLNNYGQVLVPALPAGLAYVEVAAGSAHSVARPSDGEVVAWGDNAYGQIDVPALPSGLTYALAK